MERVGTPPAIDPVTFVPYSFMSIPTQEHIDLYQRGIERVVKADRYAGLLGQHALPRPLRSRRAPRCRGFRKIREVPGSAHRQRSAAKARLQQIAAQGDLRGDPATKSFADEKWRRPHAQRLEALDRLSLYFCLGALEAATIDPCRPTTKAEK